MDIIMVLVIVPVLIYKASVSAVYLWGLAAAIAMSVVAALYYGYANILLEGFTPNGIGGGEISFERVLLRSWPVFLPFLMYFLLAAYVAYLSHTYILNWTYAVFVLTSVIAYIGYFFKDG